MKLSQAFDSYRIDIIGFKGQSHKTEEAHQVTRKCLLSYFGDVELCDLTFSMVRDWKNSMDRRGLSAATSRYYIIRLRCVLTYMQRRGEECLNPDLIPVPKRPDRVPEFVTKEDVSQLIDFALKPSRGYPRINRLRNAAIVSLLYASGIRVSELTSLNRGDIRDDGSFSIVGKGGKARLCFCDQRTVELLDKYLALRQDQHPALFHAPQNGHRMSPKTVQLTFRNLREKSGIKACVHPHTMRHSFATNLLRNNANIRYVQTLLGHSSLETTQQYTHVVNEDLRLVYAQYHTI